MRAPPPDRTTPWPQPSMNKPGGAAQREIASALASLSSRRGGDAVRQAPAQGTRARRGADARARRAARRQNLGHARRRRAAADFGGDVDHRHHRGGAGREPAARIRLAHVGVGRHHGQLRRHRAAVAAIPAARAGRQHHGRNPRPRRPQHVGEALQRPGGDARQLSQERIPADRRRGAVEDRPGPRRARARHPARGAGARRRQPHAAHGGGAEGSSGAGRADFAHGIHVQSVADAPPRRPRGDGGNLQQFRPPDRNPLHHRARRGKPRERRTHQDPDVHVRRSDQARHRLGADPDAPRREGQARRSRSRAPPSRCASSSCPTCRPAPPRC